MPPKKRLKQQNPHVRVTTPTTNTAAPTTNTAATAANTVATAALKLAEKHAHEHDVHIRFVENGHKYYVDGEEFHSVTESIQKATGKEPFNADKVIERMMSSPKGLAPEYQGMTVDQIKAEWEQRATCGTQMHACFETILNGDEAPAADRKRFSTELKQLTAHVDEMKRDGWELYRLEWAVFDRDSRLAGTMDVVWRRAITITSTDTASAESAPTFEYCIGDWKRVRTIRGASRYKMGGCFAELDECNYSKYVLQVLVYARILKRNYDIAVAMDQVYFCTMHPEKKEYMVHRVPQHKDGRRRFVTAVDAFFEERIEQEKKERRVSVPIEMESTSVSE